MLLPAPYYASCSIVLNAGKLSSMGLIDIWDATILPISSQKKELKDWGNKMKILCEFNKLPPKPYTSWMAHRY